MESMRQETRTETNTTMMTEALPWWKQRDVWIPLLVFVSVLLLYLPGLGSYPFFDPWEPHYSQVAWEMNETGTWLTPTYRERTNWFSKPILPLWTWKVAFYVFGRSEFSTRFACVFWAALGLALLSRSWSRLFSRRIALLSVGVLATSPMFFFISRQAMFDGPFVVLQTLAISYMAEALFLSRRKARSWYGFYAVSGLVMLTKGLLCIVLPGTLLALFILISGRWRILKEMRLPSGSLVFLVIASPWFVYMTAKFGKHYFDTFFIYHHFKRAAGLAKKADHDFSYYFLYLFHGFLPYIGLLLVALAQSVGFRVKEESQSWHKTLFFLLAFVVSYLFFMYTSSKYAHYILPAIPFAALLVGRLLDHTLRSAEVKGGVLRLQSAIAVLGFGFVAKEVVRNYKHLIYLFEFYNDRSMPEDFEPQHFLAGLFVLMGISLGLPLFGRRFVNAGVVGLFATGIAFTLYTGSVMIPAVAPSFSQKSLFERYRELSPNHEPICEYNSWERRSTSYYFQNRAVYLDSRKSDDRLKRFFLQPGRLFCMVDKHGYTGLKRRVQQLTGKTLSIWDSSHLLTYLVATEARKRNDTGDKVLLKEPPIPQHTSQVMFENGIRLLGYDLSHQATIAPGDKLTLTLYFQATRDVKEDWWIFVHGDLNGKPARFNGDHFPANGLLPTSRWKQGDLIRDTWSGTVDARLGTGKMELYIGFFEGGRRLAVERGRQDGENRVRLQRLVLQR